MADSIDIAKAFAPFVAIGEFENVLTINRRSRVGSLCFIPSSALCNSCSPPWLSSLQAPLFLKRNLSYTTSRQRHKLASSTTVYLRLKAEKVPEKYEDPIPVVAAVCSVIKNPDDGEEHLVPLSACIGYLPIPTTTNSTNGHRATNTTQTALDIEMEVPLPAAPEGGASFPKDIVVVLLHQRTNLSLF